MSTTPEVIVDRIRDFTQSAGSPDNLVRKVEVQLTSDPESAMLRMDDSDGILCRLVQRSNGRYLRFASTVRPDGTQQILHLRPADYAGIMIHVLDGDGARHHIWFLGDAE